MRELFKKLFTEQTVTVNYLDPKELGDPKKILHVFSVNENGETLPIGLGITDERLRVLEDICLESLQASNGIVSDAISIGSRSVKHANELAMLSIMIYTVNERKMMGGLPPGVIIINPNS